LALKVCNGCGAGFYDGEVCPACSAAGRGEIRDYHFQHEEGAVATESTTEAQVVVPEDEVVVPEDEGEETAAEEAYDQSHGSDDPDEDLSGHSRNRLSKVAGERGLDASGTKAELLARLQGDGQG
jgi:hypothetical protein